LNVNYEDYSLLGYDAVQSGKRDTNFSEEHTVSMVSTHNINIILLVDMTPYSLVLRIRRNILQPVLSLKNGNIIFWDVTPCRLVATCFSEEPFASILRPDECLDYDLLIYDAVKFDRYVPKYVENSVSFFRVISTLLY
jgi:hypothetical protein